MPAAPGVAISCEAARADRSVTLRPHPAATDAVVLDCADAISTLWLDAGQLPRATLRDLAFTRCRGDSGGCVLADDVLVTALRCTFSHSTSTASPPGTGVGGGALAVRLARSPPAAATDAAATDAAAVHLEACTFADDHSEGHGGAVYVAAQAGGSAALLRCAFERTSASGDGGAVYVSLVGQGAYVRVTSTSFVDPSGTSGGALSAEFASAGASAAALAVLDGVRVTGARASSGGGALNVRLGSADSDVSVLRTVVLRTQSGNSGGGAVAVAVAGAGAARTRVELLNSSFLECSSGVSGGAVSLTLQAIAAGAAHGRLHIARSLFSGTRARADGGAVTASVQASSAPSFAMTVEDSRFVNVSCGTNFGALGVYVIGFACANATLRLPFALP